MEQTKLLFYGTERSETHTHELECYANADNEIYLEINTNKDIQMIPVWICLNRETAIKLSKELKKQISKLD